MSDADKNESGTVENVESEENKSEQEASNGKHERGEKVDPPDTKVEQIGEERDNNTFEEDDLPLDLILKEENEQQAANDAMTSKQIATIDRKFTYFIIRVGTQILTYYYESHIKRKSSKS